VSRRLCESATLVEGGAGLRFEIEHEGEEVPAFAIRHRGRVHAFLNRCGHLPVELDWEEGRFFDASGLYLVCATHGALYAADTGHCLGGRCDGRGLTPVAVGEADGWVVLEEEGSEGV
jgi:nitrite reductase/ring-hydroxylating ferredoxin subunit